MTCSRNTQDFDASLIRLLLVQRDNPALALKFLRLGSNHLDPESSQGKYKV
jgi:hypothetical protein